MIDPQPLKGKVAIVTGAAGGIGRAYARGLAEAGAALARSIPFPFGEPEDLVGGLVFLASAASDWVTGVTLNIDGGWITRT